MEVALVPWPSEDQRRRHLAEYHQPRLLLVAAEAPPPSVDDLLEDWIRVPAHDADVQARVAMLSVRATAVRIEQRLEGPPDLDEDGVLRHAGAWVSLPPVEARITLALLGKFGAVVSREALAASAWPDGAPGRNAARRACRAAAATAGGGRIGHTYGAVAGVSAGGVGVDPSSGPLRIRA